MPGVRSGGVSLVILTVAVLLGGCTAVTTSQPLSAKLRAIDRDLFETNWLVADGPNEGVVLSVHFGRDGVAHVGGVDWDDDRMVVIEGEMIVAEGGNRGSRRFLSVRFKEHGVWWSTYLLLAYEFTNLGDLILWPASPRAIRAALEAKKLRGEVKTGEIVITSDATELLRFLDDPKSGDLFDRSAPIVLRNLQSPTGARARARRGAVEEGAAENRRSSNAGRHPADRSHE